MRRMRANEYGILVVRELFVNDVTWMVLGIVNGKKFDPDFQI